MRYVFFNTLNADVLRTAADAKCIWLDKAPQSEKAIYYIIKASSGNAPVMIEDALLSCFENISLPKGTWASFSLSSSPTSPGSNKIAFFASNDTIAMSIVGVLKKADIRESINFIPGTKNEMAGSVFAQYGYPYVTFSVTNLWKEKPDLLVLANDWGFEERFAILVARFLKIRTICLQESVIDFSESDMGRMCWADVVFVQGIHTVLELNRTLYFVTGNPRYDDIQYQKVPEKQKAFINCNFTYGIFEDRREQWLSDIVTALEKHGIDYVISQHPRDTGDLRAFRNVAKSNATLVHSQMKDCTFVISRFSSLIHEALCMGKRVIYYNPHHESMKYDFEHDNSVLFEVDHALDLKRAIETIIKSTENIAQHISDYLLVHCKNDTRSSSLSVAQLITSKPIAMFATSDYNRGARVVTDYLRDYMYYRLRKSK